MDSYGSVSFRKYALRVILSLIGVALTVAVYSTTATAGPMFYSGHEGARQRVHQVYERCNKRGYRGDYGNRWDARIFAQCIDRYLEGIDGLYFAALVHGHPGTGYSWNYSSLVEGFERALAECRKRAKNPCTLRAFTVNACIAYGYHNEYRHHGYGVGPTKEVAKRRMLGQEGRDARSCGPGCEVKQVYCAG